MRKAFALTLLLAVCCLPLGHAAKSSSDKMQIVYREQLSGEWKIWIFGPYCPPDQKLRMLAPTDVTQPIQVECVFPKEK